jgi:hypothetical protein
MPRPRGAALYCQPSLYFHYTAYPVLRYWSNHDTYTKEPSLITMPQASKFGNKETHTVLLSCWVETQHVHRLLCGQTAVVQGRGTHPACKQERGNVHMRLVTDEEGA